MKNEIFKILTKVKKDELSRIDAIDQIFQIFNVNQNGNLICPKCQSTKIDETGGDGIYCLNCHKEL